MSMQEFTVAVDQLIQVDTQLEMAFEQIKAAKLQSKELRKGILEFMKATGKSIVRYKGAELEIKQRKLPPKPDKTEVIRRLGEMIGDPARAQEVYTNMYKPVGTPSADGYLQVRIPRINFIDPGKSMDLDA
jgi:hypothetical protein